MNSVLVTGGTGFIGTRLVRRLLANNVTTYCLVRAGRQSVLPRGAKSILIPGLQERHLVRALKGIEVDTVFHLAAYGVEPLCRDPSLTYSVNVESTLALLSLSRRWPLQQFIHVGTCSEYGDAPHDKLIVEAASLNPLSLYGASKAAANLLGAHAAAHYNLPFTHLRLFNVYGPGEKAYRLCPALINALRADNSVALSTGLQARDFTFVDDVISALLHAARLPKAIQTYNVCSGTPCTVREFALSAAELLQKPKTLLDFGAHPLRKDEPMWMVGDNSKFCQQTAWRPKFSVRQGLENVITALGEHGG